MTLQTSGQISISDLVGEFGGTAPHSLSEYITGLGGLVPNTTVNSSIPSRSGGNSSIALSDYYGGDNTPAPLTEVDITLVARTYSANEAGSTTINFILQNDGDVAISGDGTVSGTPGAAEWLDRVGNNPDTTKAARVWVRAVPVSGSVTLGFTNSWLQLSTTRSWSVTRTALGTSTAVLDLQFSTLANISGRLATIRITLSATSTP